MAGRDLAVPQHIRAQNRKGINPARSIVGVVYVSS